MNFHQRNNNFLIRENGKKSYIFYVVAVIFFILIFSISWTRNLLFSVGSPLWSIENGVTSFFANNISVLDSKTNLIKENDFLKQQVSTNNQEQALSVLLKKENEDLKNILGRSTSNQKLLLADILVKPYLSAYDTLIIDVGARDGVDVGDKVVVNGDTYIGYILEVYDNTSKVVLYSSPGEKVNVLIGDNNIEKEAIGMGGGNFQVEVPREIGINEGDTIVMPSISANIFGVVEKISYKESDSVQNVLFKNPINIAELKLVEVVLSNKK